ncbi:SCP2 sterol-binding domain-containing protein [Rhodovulum sulfidophilum]|uniref:SCP2 sterol-binding domain-containing protein n=1 Tax=Rhodovulum sulfidophilum TaxID=35806 RepID=A0A0D6AYQ5_RHOSU|nr:SCP2 sterol-binding domain-containing protein [Rhodovulum sulfidophilum]ANB33838.1 sterol carrier family protein [Rhodovulum sulfidophilum DSM 1374]ANB37660.1 sterol carrier family protein [Rhodovulum sulfidophilum]MBK5922617.1 sterol carrier family protein [Rhodovulum sulfidophilum]MBL3562618.1 SCP2 sterol-binding domain-containing protein [Rhodovulum sulfidophilum]MBL3565716.1 SCP2 sterol-binding domain-containing protein [Rhodovulum sulfidophilum]
MSDTLDKAVEALNDKLSGGFNGIAKFSIKDTGDIIVDEDGAHAGDAEADVTLSASLETFRAMMEGDLNPTTAFMTGKLMIEGDMGKAMQLAQIFT